VPFFNQSVAKNVALVTFLLYKHMIFVKVVGDFCCKSISRIVFCLTTFFAAFIFRNVASIFLQKDIIFLCGGDDFFNTPYHRVNHHAGICAVKGQ
jgi:hypothetical protein